MPMVDHLLGYAIAYYQDFVKPHKHYRNPTPEERKALEDLALSLKNGGVDADSIQTEVFEVGKRHHYENLREWFKALYQILLGQDEGPRMGSFIALYGVDETVALIEGALIRDQ
jgi:lysyl-tRNA synthetase class 1